MTITRFSNGAIKDDLLATNTSFAASDMELISTIRVGSTAVSSVTFSAIPQEYKHLQIRGIARSSNAASTLNTFHVRCNSDSGTNYSWHQLYGYNNAAGSGGSASQAQMYPGYLPLTSSIGDTSLMFGGAILDLLDYSNASKYKTLRALMGFDLNYVASNPGCISLGSGLWMSTVSVNSITLLTTSGNFVTSSKFSLYGIRG